jgi:hypothetical protein
MNRKEQVIYNNDQNAATTASNESGESNYMSTSEKLFATLGNPIEMSNSIPNVNIHSTMTSTSFMRPPINTTTTTNIAKGTNQGESPMPKRNLSAYNLFFQVERENIINGEEGMNYTHENIARVALRHYQQSKMDLPRRKHRKTHGKITFAELARAIANKWKALNPSVKDMFVHRTNIEKARYQAEIAEWADKKLRAKPPSPQYKQPIDHVTYMDLLKPDIVSIPNWGGSHTGTSAIHPNEIVTQQEATMPHRVFAPSMPSQIDQSQFVANEIGTTNTLNFDNALNAASSPESGWNDSNNFHNNTCPQGMEWMSNRQGPNMGNDFGGNIQQYQQMNYSSIPVANLISLQQQLNMMIDMHGSSFGQGESYVPSQSNTYQSYSPMRYSSNPSEQLSTLRNEAAFTPNTNENYISNRALQPSVAYEQERDSLSNTGRRDMIGQGQVVYDGNFLLDENEDINNQFNRSEGN